MRHLLLIVLLWAGLSLLISSNVTRVEYAVISVGEVLLDGTLYPDPDTDIIAETSIDLSDLDEGFYHLRLRAWDSGGKSSQYTYRLIYHRPYEDRQLTHLWYCFDGDFDASASIPLEPLIPGQTWMVDSSLVFPADMPAGIHSLHLWAVDITGITSHIAPRLVIYLLPVMDRLISHFEWFFTGMDADPEQIYHHYSQNPMADITEEFIASLPALVPGELYTMHLTAMNVDGTPSLRTLHSFTYTFTVDNVTITLDGNEIIISWDAIPSAVRYWVERKAAPDADGVWIETQEPYIVLQPTLDREFYRVKAEQ